MEKNLHYLAQFEEYRKQLESMTEKNRDMEEASRYDHLTCVFNRNYVDKLLIEEYKTANKYHEPLSLAFIDLDYFKAVNDTHGHLAGDEVLKDISKFFSENIRQNDILARYGGDEFILLLPGSDMEIAEKTLQRLLTNHQKRAGIHINDNELKTTVSIGLATHMDEHSFDTLEGLLNAADKALYKAKESGRNTLMTYS